MVTSRDLCPFEKNLLLTLIGFVIQPTKVSNRVDYVYVHTYVCMNVRTYVHYVVLLENAMYIRMYVRTYVRR